MASLILQPLDLLNEELKLSLLLQRYRPVTISETSKALSEALDNIQMKLIKTESLTQRVRLRQLEANIIKELGSAYSLIMPDSILKDMKDVSELGYTTTSKGLLTHGAIQTSFSSLPKKAIDEMMDMNKLVLLNDKAYRISDFVTNQKDSHVRRFKQIVAAGIAEGATIPTISRRLKEVNQSVKRKDLTAIASTVVSEARGRGQIKALSVADDVIIGWQSVGTLDSHTSKRCGALDGQLWYKSKGYTVEKLQAKNYWYPRHFNCRSVVIPRTEISAKLDKDRSRASNGDKKGQVPAKTSFQEFFDKQSEDFKRDYLGLAKYNLYDKNRLVIRDFVDIKSGREFSIEEIKKRVGANITPMKKDLISKNIKPEELKVIQTWTKDSSEIKQTMWEIDDKFKKEADIMFSLFDNYKGNVEKGTILYRGMAVPESIYLGMGYDKLVRGSDYTPDNKAISSFSRSKRIAYDFAFEGEASYKVIIKIAAKEEENLLDITKLSEVHKEEESILHKNIWYNVSKIKRISRGGVEWLLMELK